MRRLLPAFLIVGLLLFATTYAGMAVFGMDPGTAIQHSDCMGTDCDALPMSGTDCVNHCLSTLPISGPVSASSSLLIVFAVVLLAALLVAARPHDTGPADLSRQRWDWDIGKLLLHRDLSTIVLRN
jgi:hypothetical protein